MNKKSLVELFNRLNSSEPAIGKWDQKLNEKDIQIFINMKGSEFTKEFPLVKADLYFESGTRISRIIRAIHNPNNRKIWDKDIEKAEVL